MISIIKHPLFIFGREGRGKLLPWETGRTRRDCETGRKEGGTKKKAETEGNAEIDSRF